MADRQVVHRQTAVAVFVVSVSDRHWESVILDGDSLVRPRCQSEASQHTRAGSSDKPVPLNNTTERQAENTPCCINQLIGGTTWAEGTKAREGRQGRTAVTDPALLISRPVSPSASKDNGATSSPRSKLVVLSLP